jgi:hypothetical protein
VDAWYSRGHSHSEAGLHAAIRPLSVTELRPRRRRDGTKRRIDRLGHDWQIRASAGRAFLFPLVIGDRDDLARREPARMASSSWTLRKYPGRSGNRSANSPRRIDLRHLQIRAANGRANGIRWAGCRGQRPAAAWGVGLRRDVARVHPRQAFCSAAKWPRSDWRSW